MKYIKKFLVVDTDIHIGDYVICDESASGASDEIINFLKSNVGQFIRFREDGDTDIVSDEYVYLVQYEYVPSELPLEDFDHGSNGDKFDYNTRLMKRNEIVYWSKDKEDVLLKLQENKFNI